MTCKSLCGCIPGLKHRETKLEESEKTSRGKSSHHMSGRDRKSGGDSGKDTGDDRAEAGHRGTTTGTTASNEAAAAVVVTSSAAHLAAVEGSGLDSSHGGGGDGDG